MLPSYRNQSTDLPFKSIDWFLYEHILAFNGLDYLYQDYFFLFAAERINYGKKYIFDIYIYIHIYIYIYVYIYIYQIYIFFRNLYVQQQIKKNSPGKDSLTH